MAKAKPKKPKPVSQQLRLAILNSKMTPNQICVESGVDSGAMSRFLTGKRGLTLESVDKICAVLNLSLL